MQSSAVSLKFVLKIIFKKFQIASFTGSVNNNYIYMKPQLFSCVFLNTEEIFKSVFFCFVFYKLRS